MRGFRICTVLVLARFFLQAQDLKEFEKKVTEFTLPNGMHFLVVERHDSPVVSFHTYVRAGSVYDPAGKTGLAHLFEHLAWKGSETIGTRDWTGEKRAIDNVETAYDQMAAERAKGSQADEVKVTRYEMELRSAIDRAQAYVQPNEYTRTLEDNGATGMNATTSADGIEFRYTLPSNRLELWFLMESQRLLHPALREFYLERDSVGDEYRVRVEANPQTKLLQSFLMEAFSANPYRNPVLGWQDQVKTLRRGDAKSFFETYYVPGNITQVMAGDVNPAEARRLAEHYFSPMAAKPLPPAVRVEEPAQTAPKKLVVDSTAQPQAAIGYKRPDELDADDAVFDVIQLILSGGRTSWLNRRLVEEKQVSSAVRAISSYPGARYNGLFVFYLVPAPGHSMDENLAALDEMLDSLQNQPIDSETLQRVKAQSHGLVIRRLSDNAATAELLASMQANYGSWKKLAGCIDAIDRVTPEDISRVARKYFVAANRTVAYLAPPAAGVRAPGGQPR